MIVNNGYLFCIKIRKKSNNIKERGVINLKSTGIVRKIDSLGRIVIPKEIRKNLGIKDGEILEIFLEEEKIVLSKCSSLNSIEKYSSIISDIVYNITKKNIIITDNCLVLSTNKEISDDYVNKELSSNYLRVLERRENYSSIEKTRFDVIELDDVEKNYCLVPIVVQGELLGSLFLFSESEIITESDKTILKFVLKFLEKNLED